MEKQHAFQRRNPVARELSDPRYRKQVVVSEKVYDRKQAIEAIEDEPDDELNEGD